MNIPEFDILKEIGDNRNIVNQRFFASKTNYSLGRVNKAIKNLINNSYITNNFQLLPKSHELFKQSKPRNAVILAAGYGMRMVPIGRDIPKALLEVDGEILIERIIKQLHSSGITDITIVVGYKKEMFEYLIDAYDVNLVVNREYSSKNNLHSLALVKDIISNTYIIPSDIWLSENIFSKLELYSWYMISNNKQANSNVHINRNKELVHVTNDSSNNYMVGVSYINKKDSISLKNNLSTLDKNIDYNNSFWEDALFTKGKMFVYARLIDSNKVIEINTYEQLRDLDCNSNSLHSNVLNLICNVFDCEIKDISNIQVLKKGMTNRSFLFEIENIKYIMRIPGEGTDKLINRQNEYDVYLAIHDLGFCDSPIYLDPKTGYKITKYLNNVRPANAFDNDDVIKCMSLLREFHSSHLQVSHEFDLFKQIDFYESLWPDKQSIYKDYKETKANITSLKNFIDKHSHSKSLTHIDAVPDNFLFYIDENGSEQLQLTDWEYSGIQDPHVDIAMFCIYSLYDREHIDSLIDIYFKSKCPQVIRIKIYCYIAIAGLLWSNWCEYKLSLGIEFGEYSIKQYRYAKEYYRIAKAEMENYYET
ncbi:NTP transferase domain-containing protein [Pseudobutyrivibrio xylanivorans]|uniref:CTP:phosphocholine cytidylyltransferase n=1 Tax=Pseudobutyrivibrio xylanivorans TaxID=185007 RepID=A0A1G5S4A6_PSEXY|nr:NTP transferase domain-containing protein [Pseudobutyrivibrio xylanivorans]SCZ81194.1 CTP:phosphocholine cytidylyltransferase [Pseudobutyrivibrio xylanivorans]